MTALCSGGGTSSMKLGAARYIYMGGAALGALLNNISTPWAVPLAALIAAATYDLEQICATDPPGFPSFNAVDVLALTIPGGSAIYPSSIQKWRDLVTTALWYQFCQCDSGAQPPVPPGPAQPADMPQVSTGLSNTGPNLPCFTKQATANHVTGLTKNFEPFGDVRFHANRFVLPPGTTQYRVTATSIQQGTLHTSIDIYSNECTNSAQSIGSEVILGTIASGATATFTRTPGAGVVEITTYGYDNPWDGGPKSDQLFMLLEIFCGSTPTGVISPCCPADQYVNGLLQQIYQTVTLIQRQQVPFAYVPGAIHAALAGRGEIGVQGLLGAKVEPAAIPSWAGVATGDPDALWLDSWINWGNADGWASREFLRASPYLSLPQLAGQFTKIGYSLAPGLTVTITELEREP